MRGAYCSWPSFGKATATPPSRHGRRWLPSTRRTRRSCAGCWIDGLVLTAEPHFGDLAAASGAAASGSPRPRQCQRAAGGRLRRDVEFQRLVRFRDVAVDLGLFIGDKSDRAAAVHNFQLVTAFRIEP